MDADEVVEFLDWLEAVFPIRLEFRDKRTLAEGFVEQRSHQIYDEYKREHTT
jgi:hypothetical protein